MTSSNIHVDFADIFEELYSDGENHEIHENDHICVKSIKLDVELQKAKLIIAKLQKKCAEKSSQINQLKATEKRLRLAKYNLEEFLKKFKEKKWISDEGRHALNVNI